MKRLAMLLTITALTSAFHAQAVTVNCDEFPGIGLCRSMQRATTLFKYTCTGDACYELWRSEIQAMRQITETCNNYLPVNANATPQVGALAFNTAKGLCTTNETGSCEWVKAMYVAKRDALACLVELQKGAQLPSVKSCSLSYNCP